MLTRTAKRSYSAVWTVRLVQPGAAWQYPSSHARTSPRSSASVAVTPVAQGCFGVGLEPLAQPIQGSTMERYRGRTQKILNRAAVFKCCRNLLFRRMLFI